ncbi:MAG: chromate resistance protein ChrB domain-containing protein, partial [Acidobacteriota bacterium]
AEIIHDLDLKDAKFDRPEAAGIRAMLEGLMARCPSDEERIERSLEVFDDLHESLTKRSRSRK